MLVIWGSLQYSTANKLAVLAQTAGKKFVNGSSKNQGWFNVSALKESIASLFKSMAKDERHWFNRGYSTKVR